MLRDYQQSAIDQIYAWMRANKGHPCLELPTGAGKSHIVAALCKDAVQSYPGTRILMMTHQKELIQQNAEKLFQHWPNAPLGVYSAGLKKRQLGRSITYGGVQSLRGKSEGIGHQDMVIVDECHLINHKCEGTYRTLIEELTAINPRLRVIGLTATPYRMGHGLLTDGDALFTDIIQPVSVEELIFRGFLAPLRSKVTDLHYDSSAVHKRGGDYIESELAAQVDTEGQNDEVVREVLSFRDGRKSMLFFCTGVMHAMHMRDVLHAYGVTAECVTGETPHAQRRDILEGFKRGEIEALTNANVLTTGFDAPNIDLIAMCRPTLSPGLYVQMAGRGLRLKEHTDHCLVLDFAGVVQAHGPITAVQTPEFKAKKESKGEAICKVCESCHELVAGSARTCPSCGMDFPAPEPKPLQLHNDDVMGTEPESTEVAGWSWCVYTGQKGIPMLRVDFHGRGLCGDTISEFLCLRHTGYAKTRSVEALNDYAYHCNLAVSPDDDLEALAGLLNSSKPPSKLVHKPDGRFKKIISKEWGEMPEEIGVLDDKVEAVEMDRQMSFEDEVPF